MAKIAERLHRKLSRGSSGFPKNFLKASRAASTGAGVSDLKALIDDGCDPGYVVYAHAQQLSTFFAEQVLNLPEMKAWTRVVFSAEEEYLPDGPPISPITKSFFWLWALFDLPIGSSVETMAMCQIAINDLIELDRRVLKALSKLSDSRMGMYEHMGHEDSLIRLRELVTGDEFLCHCVAGYSGEAGQLWYTRLVPPLEPDLSSHSIVMGTPYVLPGALKADWIAYLARAMVTFRGGDERSKLRRLMKFGPNPRYWLEYVFLAYHHSQFDAIFLTGIPDVKESLPHGS